MSDPTLFDLMPDAHARMSDPRSSHRAVAAIAKNGTLKQLIWEYATARYWEDWGRTSIPGTFNDTQLWEHLEIRTGQRQQRNVIARARGLMEKDGLFLGIGERLWNGHALEHYTINPEKLNV